jgi:hypothetical protein
MIGSAVIVILKMYASQKGGSHVSSGGIFSIFLALSPFLFGVLVINFNDNPRALRCLSLAIILQTVVAVAGYYHAIFIDVGLEGSLDLGLVPLYQFMFLGVAAGAVSFMDEKKPRHLPRPNKK